MDHYLAFLCLQETMIDHFSKTGLHNLCGGRNFKWHKPPPRGKSGGILVGVSEDYLDVLESEHGDHYVRMLVYDKSIDLTWDLITIYEDAQPKRKADFLAKLSRVYKNHTMPCVVGCDFNIIRKSSEKNKPNAPRHWRFSLMPLLSILDLENCR